MSGENLRNRVTATGELVATPARGLSMGNRGILHDENRHVGHVRWRHKAWVTCLLSFKGRKREIMSPGAYTELFFLDEAVALAAGHRPCAECRRPDYDAYRAASLLTCGAKEMDALLHRERALPRVFGQRHHLASLDGPPDGAIVLREEPEIVLGDTLRPVTLVGYGAPRTRPRGGSVTVVTPETSVDALRGGYRPVLHPSASA